LRSACMKAMLGVSGPNVLVGVIWKKSVSKHTRNKPIVKCHH
jgi:hypothetical protein